MPAQATSTLKSARPTSTRRRRRPEGVTQRLSKHTALLEISARLGVNGLLTVVALGALGQLVPHIQTQAQRLQAVNSEVAVAEVAHAKLKSDFGRYFDPWQAGKIMQEQSGYKVSNERQVVWTTPIRPE
ncbi:MAG: hypothetical protein ACFCVD_22055 [Nodosilinea sp.]